MALLIFRLAQREASCQRAAEFDLMRDPVQQPLQVRMSECVAKPLKIHHVTGCAFSLRFRAIALTLSRAPAFARLMARP